MENCCVDCTCLYLFKENDKNNIIRLKHLYIRMNLTMFEAHPCFPENKPVCCNLSCNKFEYAFTFKDYKMQLDLSKTNTIFSAQDGSFLGFLKSKINENNEYR